MSVMDKLFGKTRTGGEGEGGHWLSVSDLMAGLMMVFLFISIALMRAAFIERDRVKEVAVAYQDNQVAIYESLIKEFDKDLESWDAEIDRETLAFNFRSPDVLFAAGRADIRPGFADILSDFFPRYVDVISQYKNSVDEIRIEGHTSSEWVGASNRVAYFRNMELSQGRTRAVLEYVSSLQAIGDEEKWIRRHFAAVGYSSARLVLDDLGTEDFVRSRRVSFRVITNAETQIRRIIEG